MKSTFNANVCLKSVILATVCLLFCLPLSANNNQTARFQLPEFQAHTLDNGLQVFLMEHKEVPMIDVQLVFKAGAILDQKHPGLAQATADNLLFGTQKMSKVELEKFLEFRGVSLSSEASLERTSLIASYLTRDNEQVLPILADIATQAQFAEAEWLKYQKRRLDQLKRRKESPSSVAYDYFKQLIYPNHPYQSIAEGTVAGIESANINSVRNFYNTYYRPDNAALVLVGDFDSKVMLKFIQRTFAAWQTPKAQLASMNIGKPKAPSEATVLLVNKADARQSTFYIGGPGINYNDPDYIPLSVINTILGGRFTSWLNDALRVNAGLTYGARSSFIRSSKAGSFAISTFTDTKTTEEAIDLALTTYNRLWQPGIDAKTLDSAKAYLKGQFPPRYETSTQLAAFLASMFIHGYDKSYVNDFETKVNSLTQQQAQALVSRHFPKDNLQFLVIGKAEEIRDIVKKYGKVIEIDINDAGFSIPQ